MEGFFYTDIFATKGIEYLVIIAFLALLIPFSIILNRQIRITKKLQAAFSSLSAGILRIPQGFYYGRNHTWMFMERSGIAKVGVDDLLLHLTGAVQFANLRTEGESIIKGEILAEMIQDGKTLTLLSPVSGKVVKTNELLKEPQAVIADDPYGQGWIYQIKPVNWMSEIKSCYFAAEATRWSEQELVRFRDFLSTAMNKQSADPSMVVLQDGGELCDHSLAMLPGGVWEDFQKDFLNLYRISSTEKQ